MDSKKNSERGMRAFSIEILSLFRARSRPLAEYRVATKQSQERCVRRTSESWSSCDDPRARTLREREKDREAALFIMGRSA